MCRPVAGLAGRRVLSVAYNGVSPPCCLRRAWPRSYAGPNGGGRARAAGIDAPPGGQVPPPAADMEGEKD